LEESKALVTAAVLALATAAVTAMSTILLNIVELFFLLEVIIAYVFNSEVIIYPPIKLIKIDTIFYE